MIERPIDEIVAATAGFNTEEDSVVDRSQNKINVALYHIETLRQLMPDLSAWSEERAQAVNSAIAAMEAAIKGREADDSPYVSLRQTVAAARKDPRDIDVMIALSDRALDIEDLLAAHDKYSIGIRTALIDLKPLAVEYVRVPKRRAATTTRKRSTTSRTSSTAAKSTASKSTASRRWSEPSQPGTPAACSPTSGRSRTLLFPSDRQHVDSRRRTRRNDTVPLFVTITAAWKACRPPRCLLASRSGRISSSSASARAGWAKSGRRAIRGSTGGSR